MPCGINFAGHAPFVGSLVLYTPRSSVLVDRKTVAEFVALVAGLVTSYRSTAVFLQSGDSELFVFKMLFLAEAAGKTVICEFL